MTLDLIDPGPSRKGWHRLQNVLQCPRKYALYMAAKAGAMSQFTRAPALIKGTLLHTGLAHRYAIQKAEQENTEHNFYSPLDAVSAMVEKQPNPPDWEKHAPLVKQVLLDYEAFWQAEQWEVMDVEKELCASIMDSELVQVYLYTQRADLIVRNKRSGKWFIIDHKTTVRIAPKTIRRYTLSGQFLGYTMFGRGLIKEDFGGVVLNLVQWPSAKKEASFQRVTLEPAPFADRTFKQTIIHAERLIQSLTKKHTEPLDWPGVHHETACWTPYGPCPHLELCQWGV